MICKDFKLFIWKGNKFMKFKELKKISLSIITLFCLTIALSTTAFGIDKSNEISFGQDNEYGSIYGAEYDPDNGNNSKWLTIQPGENGVRIIDENNHDIVMVDKYGGVYINGTLFVNNQKYVPASPGMFTPGNGFIYLLIVINLCFNIYLLLKIRKKN